MFITLFPSDSIFSYIFCRRNEAEPKGDRFEADYAVFPGIKKKKKSVLNRKWNKENIWYVKGGTLLNSCQNLAALLQLSLLKNH